MPGRSKRSPRHDDDLEYPTWDGRVNLSINGVTLTNEPTSEGAPYVDVMRVVHQVLHKSGLIPSWPARTDVPTVWPSQHARQLIRELQGRGVDGDTLLRMLIGLDPRQRLGLPLLVNQILSARRDDQTARERNRALERLRKRYHLLERNLSRAKLFDDPLFTEETREALRREVSAIRLAIAMLRAHRQDHPRKNQGITVKPSRDLFHNRFWNRPMIALVKFLEPHLKSREESYRIVADLLGRAFESPLTPKAVRSRVLRATTTR